MRLEPKPHPSTIALILYPLGAVAATRAIASLLVMAAGASPLSVFGLVLKGAAGSQFALLETLTRATPLIFTGLAVAVAFRARLWNIGAEAQLYVGGIVTVVLGTGLLPLPAPILIPVIVLATILAGGLVLLGPAILKTRFGVDEVVTTLLLNFVVLLFVSMLLEGVLKDPMGLGWPQSQMVTADARLPRIVEGRRLHYGFVIALVAAFAIWFVMKKTALGYEMRVVGANTEAARFAGIPVNAVLMKTALISGGLAALGGFSEVAGLKGNLTLDLSSGFGYTGIVVAMLAMLNPLGVVAAAIFVAGIFVGADAMSRAAGVPSYIAEVMVATALLTMVTAIMLSRYKVRWR
ncbi:ABC transporter permease [Aliihoeflea sp. 40Bstr573]|uniref:ABC transporter permease n=1 Tax=Aliihoeflea sp. 40Bstr573 TaxID=2696467 RepID=UPI0020963C6E|nr:ABC transporter permease [Aliihoeflea sp. 40Bstr573]MCO6388402.1 ABC transporter permease [Aliihoeflea sp. 40Bstr573]